MAAQYVVIKRISSLDTPITAEKLDGSLFTTENQAHEFIISVRKNGVKQTVTGSVSGKFIRANGTTIFLQGSIADGDAVVRLHQDCYNVQGRFTFNIFNTQSGVTTCIYSAVGKMDMGSTETVIDAGDVVPDLSDVVAKQEEMTQVIADARAATSAASQAATEGENKFVRFDASQTLTEAQKGTARTNIDSPSNAEITELKSTLDKLSEVSAEGFDKTEVTPPLGLAEAMIVEVGGVSTSSGYDARYWTPVNGHKLLFVDYSLSPTNTAIAIGFFNAENASASTIVGYIKSTVADEVYRIPDDAEYIALTVPTGETHKITFYDNDVLEHISDINEKINEISTFESNGQMINPNTTNVLNGYLADKNSTDTKYNSGSNFRSIYVPIKQNTYYTIQDYVDGNNTKFYRSLGLFSSIPTSGAIGKRMDNTRPVYTFYSGEYSYVVIYVYNSTSDTLTFKEKLEKIKLEKGAIATKGFVYGEGARSVDESNLSYKLKSKVKGAFGFASPYFYFDDSIATGEGLSLTVPNCKKGTLLNFSANISGSFGSIKVGQGNTATNETGYIVVDDTNLYVYYYGNSEQLVATKAHGLTIADYIEITIETLSETFNKAKFTISSGGASYSYTDMYLGCSVNAYATSVNGTFINCVLTYFCTDWYKKMWLFGDSYFDHWVQYACEKGYVNFLCDGYSGRTSQPAYDSFKKNLAKGTPQYAVWCIGMNNGDNVSSINSTWLTVVLKFIQDCEANGITPILCTIPNVPTVNNNYKNAWIRNSGYRYIELAKMVGSDISTSWYSGLLSNDGVHPSTAGDKMIAMFMITQLPEMK